MFFAKSVSIFFIKRNGCAFGAKPFSNWPTSQPAVHFRSGMSEDTTSTIAGACKQGAKSWQEDAHLCFVSKSRRVVCGAVFDGHGGFNGMLASAHCRDSTLAMLHRLEDEFDSWSAAQWSTHLSEHFDHLHTTLRELLIKPPQEMPGSVSSGSRYADGKGVVRQANGDPVHGGSTGMNAILHVPSFFNCFFSTFLFLLAASGSVVVFVENLQGDRFLVSANVGDSDVILVNPKHTDWRRFSEVCARVPQFSPHKAVFSC
jgi:serine/threonine protein phosphatase PrpC